jgi:hypothetical protein
LQFRHLGRHLLHGLQLMKPPQPKQIQQAKDAFGKKRITMTGKMGGAQDDLYITLAMMGFWPTFMRKNARAYVGANVGLMAR